MKQLLLFCVAILISATTFATTANGPEPKIFIVASNGFDTDLTAAISKKKTPAIVVGDKAKADFILEVAPVNDHEESTGSKVARCLFLDCIGMNGYSSVSVKLTRVNDSAVVWAYQVRKGMSGPAARQSLSEAIAKHLKNDYLDKQAK
ncbi:MAG: hypothetical protein KGK08_09660 [Acidobacteriota bacterium]|nr:hypothetical protein [Acidobacteriota bacterium]